MITSRSGNQTREMPMEAPGRSTLRHLHLADLYEILELDEGPAAQIRADHRGDWADELIPDVGLAPTRRRGRFNSPIGPGSLLDGVADVALVAACGDPGVAAEISKSAWDRARREQERTNLPSAEAVRQRFGLAWRRILELALTDRSQRTKLLGQWDGSYFAGWGPTGPKEALRTVKAVAIRIGHAPAPFEYDEAARAMEAESGRRRTGRLLLLPRSVYVVSEFESWSAALQEAGLEPRPGHPSSARVAPPVETLDQFIEEVGFLPNSAYFLEWCRRRDIPTARLVGGWAGVVADVRRLRAARGASTPEHATRPKDLPPLPNPVPRVRRMAFRHSREAILASLRRYGELHLPPGGMPRQKHYLAACRKDPKLIWPSAMTGHGRFHDLCLEAGIE